MPLLLRYSDVRPMSAEIPSGKAYNRSHSARFIEGRPVSIEMPFGRL